MDPEEIEDLTNIWLELEKREAFDRSVHSIDEVNEEAARRVEFVKENDKDRAFARAEPGVFLRRQQYRRDPRVRFSTNYNIPEYYDDTRRRRESDVQQKNQSQREARAKGKRHRARMRHTQAQHVVFNQRLDERYPYKWEWTDRSSEVPSSELSEVEAVEGAPSGGRYMLRTRKQVYRRPKGAPRLSERDVNDHWERNKQWYPDSEDADSEGG